MKAIERQAWQGTQVNLFSFFITFFPHWDSLGSCERMISVHLAEGGSVFLLSIFSCCTKSGDKAQEDLAKYGYRTTRETKKF
jgi:hypothetical protein